MFVQCNSESMSLIFDQCVVPDTSSMALRDTNCLAKSRNASFYEIETRLDGCGTKIETSDKKIHFQNTLHAMGQRNSIIAISSDVQIDFRCSYETVVESIHAEMMVKARYVMTPFFGTNLAQHWGNICANIYQFRPYLFYFFNLFCSLFLGIYTRNLTRNLNKNTELSLLIVRMKIFKLLQLISIK